MPIKTKRVKLTMRDAIELSGAIDMTSGREKIATRDGKDVPVLVAYKFGDGVPVALAINKNLLKPFLEVYQEQRNDLIARFKQQARDANGGEPIDIEASTFFADFLKEERKLQKTEDVFRMRVIDEADFKIDSENSNMPAHVIAGLLPIMRLGKEPEADKDDLDDKPGPRDGEQSMAEAA